jgi:hypothetical protein
MTWWQPLASAGLEIVASLVLALGGAALLRLYRWLGLSQDAQVREYLDAALKRAVDFGVAEARRKFGLAVLAPGGDAYVHAVDAAAAYARQTVPDALRHFGIDDGGLVDRLRARLPSPAASLAG